MIFKNIRDMIGNTPILMASKYCDYYNLNIELYVKLEGFNPTGSVKDRAVLNMIKDLENKGMLRSGSTIIEATSGNTGISIAAISSYSGYDSVIVMPLNMSIERRKMIEALGGRVELTEASLGMSGAIKKAKELNEKIPNSIILDQFNNYNNVLAHYNTAIELINDLKEIDAVIMGVGTGGTISGVASFFKDNDINTKIIAVEPTESNVLSGGCKGSHKIQGIGAGFIPSILRMDLIDEIISVSYNDCILEARAFAKTEGILLGISSGAILHAARLCSKKYKKIAVVLPDLGYKYLSTDLYE